MERIEDDPGIRTGVCPNAAPNLTRGFNPRKSGFSGFTDKNSMAKIAIWLSLSSFPLIVGASYFLYPPLFILAIQPVLVLIYLGPPLIFFFSFFYICFRIGGRVGKSDSESNAHVKGWVEMAIGRDSIKGPIGSRVDRTRSSRPSSLSGTHPKTWQDQVREKE